MVGPTFIKWASAINPEIHAGQMGTANQLGMFGLPLQGLFRLHLHIIPGSLPRKTKLHGSL